MIRRLHYGDNLDLLRAHVPEASVDLIYLDPPFNSAANYNVLFKAPDGSSSESQIEAFADTWEWGHSAVIAYEAVVTGQNSNASTMLRAMRTGLGENALMAYLAMMAVRLVELHRVLKPSGSLYLHCDPTASHYLKLILDSIFGPRNFLGHIVWRRTAAHSSTRRWPRLHDDILAFARSSEFAHFIPQKVPADPGWIEREYRYEDERGRYSLDNLTGAGTTNGPSGLPWRSVDPRKIGAGRHWRYHPDKLDELDREGRIHWPIKGQFPKLKQYLSESSGTTVGDVWSDVPVIGRTATERLGYPTQKPLTLLERIINASSKVGDVVLDPFCGCGTAVHAAERLGRQWIGMDITHLAISLIERRMADAFPTLKFEVLGTPRDISGARNLAARDKYQFQWWAVSLLDAVPQAGQKKGADRGIDGIRWVRTGPNQGDLDRVLVSVKGGENVSVRDVRDLVGTVEREGALGGVLVTLVKPTRDMLREAASHGMASTGLGQFRKVMVKTIDELLAGVHDDAERLPPLGRQEGFRRAAREKAADRKQEAMDL